MSLLDAGLRIADESGLAGVTVQRVIDAARSSKGAFFHHFRTRQAYLVALHRRFHDGMLEHILTELDGVTPGRDRLLKGFELYLDAFNGVQGIRGLLIDARSEPLVLAEVARRTSQVAEIIETDLKVMGWPEPAASARLLVATVSEAAIIEHEHKGPHRPTRLALQSLLLGWDSAAQPHLR